MIHFFIYIVIIAIQYYLIWATYRNWFKHEVIYTKMEESFSYILMTWSLPIFVWIPILPLFIVGVFLNIVGGLKYITLRWVKGIDDNYEC